MTRASSSPRKLLSRRDLAALSDDILDAGSREHYADAELYDYEYRRRRADVAFYRRLAARVLGSGGRVLDLACGSGRIALALARDGHEVVGIDTSQPMLDRAAARLARLPEAVRDQVTLVRGDMRSFQARGRFDLVIAAFNAVEHLYTRVDVAAWLAAVTRHLTPTGRLAFDVQMPDLAWLLRDSNKRWARTRFTHPRTGERLWYSTNHDYEPVSQICQIRLYYEPVEGRGPTRVVKLWQRKFFPAELEALVAASGYAMVERYGDFLDQPLDAGAESQVLVCARAPRLKPPGTARRRA